MLRGLKKRIVRDEEDEKSIRQWETAVRISKRVALAELIGKYIEERDARRVMPKKKRKKRLPPLSPNDCFIDLLFPETIKNLSKMAQGMQVIKKKTGPREDATSKFNYWLQLGEPLAVMAQRYGIVVVALLPEAEASIRTVSERFAVRATKLWVNLRTLPETNPLSKLNTRELRRFTSLLQKIALAHRYTPDGGHSALYDSSMGGTAPRYN
jgi:hypothetical protein